MILFDCFLIFCLFNFYELSYCKSHVRISDKFFRSPIIHNINIYVQKYIEKSKSKSNLLSSSLTYSYSYKNLFYGLFVKIAGNKA